MALAQHKGSMTFLVMALSTTSCIAHNGMQILNKEIAQNGIVRGYPGQRKLSLSARRSRRPMLQLINIVSILWKSMRQEQRT